jgi:dCTP deaminase
VTYSDVDIIEALGRDQDATDNWIRVTPLEAERIQPASIDLLLGCAFVHLMPGRPIDMRDRVVQTCLEYVGSPDAMFALKPGEFVLGTTVERIEIGPRICAKIEGKSSLGRMGLAVHVTAGFVDPGFRGQITLELFNIGPSEIRLRPGLPICQVAFSECVSTARRPYGSPGLGSRYQDQAGVVPVRP